MALTQVTLDRSAVRELLKSDEVRGDLERRAESISEAAGDGHEVDSDVGTNRARASVRTVTVDAMRAEATGHNLLSAVDAGRQ